ncbi:MAG: nucleotidyltransferase [Gemmatimonadales bacterium]
MNVATLETIAGVLNGAGVQFIVVGGLAVVAHGYGRFTADIDLVVPLDSGTVDRFFHALGSLGYRPRVPVSAGGIR